MASITSREATQYTASGHQRDRLPSAAPPAPHAHPVHPASPHDATRTSTVHVTRRPHHP
ncbi:hypothetical protein [Streptomyces sp. SPB162]|uniref:hypothetical protein n=1 Tax=Streptomyces sp. SPB162 TaxID=2940560 RepID=UPI002405BF03|nr:hypothetical protein [Streptomyces sp. SPB162]